MLLIERDEWEWEAPELTAHRGISLGATAGSPVIAPQLSTRWDAFITRDQPVTVWAMCSCSWTGPTAAATAGDLDELGRPGIIETSALEVHWRRHVRHDHRGGVDDPAAELDRLDSLFAAWDRHPPADALWLYCAVAARAAAREERALKAARRAGMSWQEIADRLGVTQHAAYERYATIDGFPPS